MRRAVMMWGVIGALSFLVLVQGYELFFSESVSLVVKGGVALIVGVVSAILTRRVERWLLTRANENGRA